jgi:hypothetical protein
LAYYRRRELDVNYSLKAVDLGFPAALAPALNPAGLLHAGLEKRSRTLEEFHSPGSTTAVNSE